MATTAAVASDYPERPITMVVTFSAGGSSDVLARAVANALSQGLGKSVVVENRPGAGGHIGAEIVSRARPDGYTILFGTNGTLGIGPAIYKNLRYNPAKDLVPVGILHKLPLMLIVQNNIPANNLQEFIAYAKAHPGKLTFASAGVGTASHLSGELLKEAAGIEILHVPYKGGGGAAPDLLAGNVSMMIETIPTALPFVANKQLRALGVTTRERSPTAPEVPTFAEQGLKDFDVTAWTGLFVPAGTPPEIIARLNAETLKIAQSPDYVAQIKKMGTDVATSSPEEFRKFVDTDVARWTEVVKRSGAQID
ncbi:Bug family tripartite tricarboxylate transporter substrate binding protein [Pseudolabrys taiwanensis]|uniref:Bug family tripartite tricarboxylate transporter substrate binding protein n=1 Tax=Pseudolabrys taiwanensis TaxID=331696 RepID=UPI0013B40F3C|nr:tripartite tricarboxylate transporter substrate binding protein [Pseudolabrys taiwanensis]